MGAFLAALVLMGCYWPQIQEVKALDIKQYGTAVYNGGAAGILCPFPPATQSNLGYLFLQEFTCSAFVGLVIWACIDPTNPFQTPVSLTYTIGISYALMIWGFGSQALSMNSARDLGTRIVAAIFFGKEAFTYLNFSWIPTLVNLPAYILAAGFYEYMFRDCLKNIGIGHEKHQNGHEGVVGHLASIGVLVPRNESRPNPTNVPRSDQTKTTVQHVDHIVSCP